MSGGSERMRAIAEQRLASLRAMRALAAEESRILAAVDAAARGEVGQGEAEDLVASHLAARDACLASMRDLDAEWRELARGAAAWPAADAAAIARAAHESLALLSEIDAGDARFAAELAARRQGAAVELARTDQARVAQRAYAGTLPTAPRFTDRRG